jgi:site-specific DNA-methyltransferase (adenine-specific)
MVLDPFAGASTTGLAALKLGRSFIGIELNPAYVEMSNRRLAAAIGVTESEAVELNREVQLRFT